MGSVDNNNNYLYLPLNGNYSGLNTSAQQTVPQTQSSNLPETLPSYQLDASSGLPAQTGAPTNDLYQTFSQITALMSSLNQVFRTPQASAPVNIPPTNGTAQPNGNTPYNGAFSAGVPGTDSSDDPPEPPPKPDTKTQSGLYQWINTSDDHTDQQSVLFPDKKAQPSDSIKDPIFFQQLNAQLQPGDGTQKLNDMIKIGDDGQFHVTFPGAPDKPITVSPLELNQQDGVQSTGFGPKILERAYLKLMANQPDSKLSNKELTNNSAPQNNTGVPINLFGDSDPVKNASTLKINEDGSMAFNPDAFSDNMKQGDIGDCFVISSINAALRDPKVGKAGLARMITPFYDKDKQGNPELKYKVTFPGYPNDPVTVDSADLQKSKIYDCGAGEKIMELAFAKLNDKKKITGDTKSSGAASEGKDGQYKSISSGGDPAAVLQALTGNKGENKDLDKSGNIFSGWLTDSPKEHNMKQLSDVMNNPQDYLVTANTYDDKDLSKKDDRFVPNHAYTLEVDPKTKKIYVINPWDTEHKRFEISQDDLGKYFENLSITKVS